MSIVGAAATANCIPPRRGYTFGAQALLSAIEAAPPLSPVAQAPPPAVIFQSVTARERRDRGSLGLSPHNGGRGARPTESLEARVPAPQLNRPLQHGAHSDAIGLDNGEMASPVVSGREGAGHSFLHFQGGRLTKPN